MGLFLKAMTFDRVLSELSETIAFFSVNRKNEQVSTLGLIV